MTADVITMMMMNHLKVKAIIVSVIYSYNFNLDESYDYFGSGEDVDDRDYSTGHQELEIIDHLQQNNVTHQNNTTGHQKSKIIDVTQNTNSTEYQESVEVINGPLGDKGSGHNTGHQELGGVNVDNVIVIETGNY